MYLISVSVLIVLKILVFDFLFIKITIYTEKKVFFCMILTKISKDP